MRVKCVLCDEVEEIDDGSPHAKKLRNRRNTMHLCSDCSDRISLRTKERKATGNFNLYREKKTDEPLI
ncbi:YlaI family protein [Terribacillus sp. 179-K 1B1 HS]|uniref:YlaI family protein n=1 Tax=Terribacillus sp. 179-K 1B1 HS TaxID=3142388 RepID=UPI0039A20EB7